MWCRGNARSLPAWLPCPVVAFLSLADLPPDHSVPIEPALTPLRRGPMSRTSKYGPADVGYIQQHQLAVHTDTLLSALLRLKPRRLPLVMGSILLLSVVTPLASGQRIRLMISFQGHAIIYPLADPPPQRSDWFSQSVPVGKNHL